jgi:hypothetical protein
VGRRTPNVVGDGLASILTAAPTEDTYLGLTATVFHVVGLYAGSLLMLVSAFDPERWLDKRRPSS